MPNIPIRGLPPSDGFLVSVDVPEFGSRFLGIGTLLKPQRLAVPANQRGYGCREEFEVKRLIDDLGLAIGTTIAGRGMGQGATMAGTCVLLGVMTVPSVFHEASLVLRGSCARWLRGGRVCGPRRGGCPAGE